jgi:hypothetical protein
MTIVLVAGLAIAFLLFASGREKLGVAIAFIAMLWFFLSYAASLAPPVVR